MGVVIDIDERFVSPGPLHVCTLEETQIDSSYSHDPAQNWTIKEEEWIKWTSQAGIFFINH